MNRIDFYLLFSLVLMTDYVYAISDVTSKYIVNADFNSSFPVSGDIYGYGNAIGDGGVYGFQDVAGWSKVIIREDPNYSNYPNSGMGAGVLAYGSSNRLCGNNVSAPLVGPFGNSGNCLGFFAVWGNGGYYYQNVTLPTGKYSVTVPVYNACGTQEYHSYIGFIAENGNSYIIEDAPREKLGISFQQSSIYPKKRKV